MDVTTYTGAKAPQESTMRVIRLQRIYKSNIGLRWNVYIYIYLIDISYIHTDKIDATHSTYIYIYRFSKKTGAVLCQTWQ